MAFRVAATAFFLCSSFRVAYAKIYERCELAHELRDVHDIPEHQLATWMCITNYESHWNTSAHNPGSGDHGLFQISELYWCSPPGVGLSCGLTCAELKNEDIEDDVICAKRIFRQHQRISGDGFTAWVVYNLHCRNPVHVASFLDGCFDYENSVKYGYQPSYAAMNLPTVMVPMPTPAAARANVSMSSSVQPTTPKVPMKPPTPKMSTGKPQMVSAVTGASPAKPPPKISTGKPSQMSYKPVTTPKPPPSAKPSSSGAPKPTMRVTIPHPKTTPPQPFKPSTPKPPGGHRIIPTGGFMSIPVAIVYEPIRVEHFPKHPLPSGKTGAKPATTPTPIKPSTYKTSSPGVSAKTTPRTSQGHTKVKSPPVRTTPRPQVKVSPNQSLMSRFTSMIGFTTPRHGSYKSTTSKPTTHHYYQRPSPTSSRPSAFTTPRSKVNPVKPRQTKFDANSFKFRPDEKVYAVINDSGYSYAISSRGFKLVFTGQ